MVQQEQHAQSALDSRNYSSLAALVFLLLDYIWTCKAEYIYIWRGRLTYVKALYLSSRYLALIAQIAHYSLVHVLLLHPPVLEMHCRAWWSFLMIVYSLLTVLLDTVLFLRVYALYMKDVRVYLFTIPLASQIVVRGFLNRKSISIGSPFNDLCDVLHVPTEAIYLAVACVVSHLVLWIATLAKRNVAQGRAAVVKLVVHEGAWIFILFVVITAIITPYTFTSQRPNPFFIFVWPNTVMSVATCRLIMNMRTLELESTPSGTFTKTGDFRLTTIFSVDEIGEGSEFHMQGEPIQGK